MNIRLRRFVNIITSIHLFATIAISQFVSRQAFGFETHNSMECCVFCRLGLMINKIPIHEQFFELSHQLIAIHWITHRHMHLFSKVNSSRGSNYQQKLVRFPSTITALFTALCFSLDEMMSSAAFELPITTLAYSKYLSKLAN